MIDMTAAVNLMRCFPGSFINHNGEFIAHRRANAYFCLAKCEDETDVKARVLEWLSRAASKGQPYKRDKANEDYRRFMLDGINSYLGTSFSHDDIDEVYSWLGNRCCHERTLKFIASGYRVDLLPFREEAS